MVEWRLEREHTHTHRGLEWKLCTFLVWVGWMDGWVGLDSVTTVDCKAHLAWRLLFGEERAHTNEGEEDLELFGVERASEQAMKARRALGICDVHHLATYIVSFDDVWEVEDVD